MTHGETNPKDRMPKSERNPNPKIRNSFFGVLSINVRFSI
jgi:hypothetical protein